VHRLVIALTTLLALTGVVVVGGYLFLFAGSADRAARLAPADTLVYASVYLQPSAGQRADLDGLITRFPGFGDPATLDEKIDEMLQRYLRDAGLDYRADVRPWLGDQVAFAFSEGGGELDEMTVLVIAAARDEDEALAAIPRLADSRGDRLQEEEHAGHRLWVGSEAAYALVDGMLLIGDRADRVRAAIDSQRGAATSLADLDQFGEAMDLLPVDRLASVYVDLLAMSRMNGSGEDEMAGYSTASMALIAEPEGLHVVGQAPFDHGAAGDSARRAFALATEPSSLTGWMPLDTEVSIVFFGAQQVIEAADEQAGTGGALGEFSMALNQLRGIAAFGLGINVDNDLLPLFDREAALALSDLDADPPSGILLLRPSDPEDASAALDRMSAALGQRGSSVDTSEIDGVTVTTVSVPDIFELSWATTDGVIVVSLEADAIGAALEAQRTGRSLAASDGYRATFDVVDEHAGNEIYLDARGLLELAAMSGELPAELHAMLGPIRALGLTIPARDDRLEFHLVLPIE
jgi:hypothetical protein